jgi:hypothetical protein
MKMARGTCRDLAACFTWKQIGIEFLSLASRLAEARRRVVHMAPSWRLCQVHAEDGRIDVMSYIGPCYPYFTVYIVLDPRGSLVF